MCDKFLPCWDFFNCPKKLYNTCKAYLHFNELNISNTVKDCWFYVDSQIGGPAKRGPCISCPMFKKEYPDISSIFADGI